MKKILLLFIVLFLIPSVFSQEYVVTNLENNEKWFFRKEEIVLPEIRGNITTEDRICKVEIRIPMDVMKIPTEKDKRERPEDVFDNFLVFERELVGFYKCSDIEITKNGETHEEPKNIINFKTIIILILIFIVVVGFMYALSLRTQHRKIIPLILFTFLLIPVASVNGSPPCSIPYWDCGIWDGSQWVSSPQVIQTTYRYHSPIYSSEIARDFQCLGFSFINQTFKYNSCDRLNISFWQWTYSTYSIKVLTKNNITLWSSDGYPTGWTYRSFDLPYSISGEDFIEFLNDGGGLCTSSFIDDVFIHCEDPYSSENWVDNGDFEILTTTTTIPPEPPTEINYCDRLYLILDGGILVFLESILFFVMNLLLCLTPMYVFLFFVAIAGIILLVFKSFKKW